MKLLGPNDTCSGAVRQAGPRRGSQYPVCLRCARFDTRAQRHLGTMRPAEGGTVECDEVLYDGRHAAESERMQQAVTSLHRGVDS